MHYRNPVTILFVLIVLVLSVAGGCKSYVPEGMDDILGEFDEMPGGDTYDLAWSRHDSLVRDLRFKEALIEVRMILASAHKEKDQANWTRALIAASSSMMSLGDLERGILLLKNAPWPEDTKWHIPLELYYANGLEVYSAYYRREINHREIIAGSDSLDITQWTQEKLDKEITAAYLRLWDKRETWGNRGLGDLGKYFTESTYPGRIRGTIRGVYSYAFATEMNRRVKWHYLDGEKLHRLDVLALIEGSSGGHESVNPGEDNLHPLQVMAAVLDDLEQWHRANNEPEAALAAYLEKLSNLKGTAQSWWQVPLRKNLKLVLANFDPSYPWWAHGQALLAEVYQGENNPDSKMLAHNAARIGFERHPESTGGNNCKVIMEQIERRTLELSSMKADSANQRSMKINHTNLDKVYFRAWRLDLESHLKKFKNVEPENRCRPYKDWFKNQEADLEWTVEVPNSGDYRRHATYTTLPVEELGYYLVACSTRRDFAEQSNIINTVTILVSDLVLIVGEAGNKREISVRSGKDGRALSGVEIKIYQNIPYGHKLVHTAHTDETGLVLLPSEDYTGSHHFIFAKQGRNLATSQSRISISRPRYKPTEQKGAIFTDRSIYRPGQILHWKVVGYEVGDDYKEYKTIPETPLIVSLKDANRKIVATDTLFTNEIGTASGEFRIPDGRTLGGWTLSSSLRGYASFRVEEYKRPTFEVLFPDQEEALRLNRPVKLTGSAQYYFGLPVTEGTVKWRVLRSSYYSRGYNQKKNRIVAAGEAQLNALGQFEVTFTPEVDEHLAHNKRMRYRYRLTADVTDAGGEVHVAEKHYLIGFVSVDAGISSDWEMMLEGTRGTLSVMRSNLNGEPRPGKGTWSLLALEQPDNVLLPADVPNFPEETDVVDPYRTPGDSMKGRWQTAVRNYEVISSWPTGAQLKDGELEHGFDGTAEIKLPKLRAGAYRLVYETNDEESNLCQITKNFLVAGKKRTPLTLPLVLECEKKVVKVGETARFIVKSALKDQDMVLEIFQDRKRIKRKFLKAGKNKELLEITITEKLRGGFSVQLSAVRDHQFMVLSQSIYVPYDNKELEVEFTTFRNLLRPGKKESFSVKIKGTDGKPVDKETTELLAYMYDRSLDIFKSHNPPNLLRLFGSRSGGVPLGTNLGVARTVHRGGKGFYGKGQTIHFEPHLLVGTENSGMSRVMAFDVEGAQYMVEIKSAGSSHVMGNGPVPAPEGTRTMVRYALDAGEQPVSSMEVQDKKKPEVVLRRNFSETAFFAPHIKVDDDGAATIEFEVPDSVTDWNVWVHAITTDLRSGSALKQASSVKELMVRTYLPRFLREGDQADLKVVLNNAGENTLTGTVSLEIVGAETGRDRAADFGLTPDEINDLPFTVDPDGGVDLTFSLEAPVDLTSVIVRVKATAGAFSDGEQRPLPILPSRLHLMQSRFVALNNKSEKELHFADMAKDDDPTLTHDQLVVTVDGQLFYGVLGVLPYLVEYPYESTEQIMNRYLSTGIVTSVFDKYPSVASMAKKLSERDTRYERFDEPDPNLKLRLEETPWLNIAAGGKTGGENQSMINVLDPQTAGEVREQSLDKLKQLQSSGGFPWRAGGHTSPYMTLYILSGWARGLEFGVNTPKRMVQQAWAYMHRHFENNLVEKMIEEDCCLQTVTYLNYILSCYPDESYYRGTFTSDQRELMLAKSFENWRKLSPRLMGYLALTLDRSGRGDDARLVFGAVMDGAIEDDQLGTYWAPEDRAWLWYNDTIESHAATLRVLTELDPQDERRHGMVHWLLMNKKLNHWQSTRSTAEVIYALVHYLDKEQMLGLREEIVVEAGPVKQVYVFEPDEYTGKKNQLVIAGVDIDPATSSTITVSKETKGLAFASATWHFSTDKLPEEARGDLFQVERRSFKRELVDKNWVLSPLDEGAEVTVGDQVEVQLTIRAKHAAEYVHLRDPRGAGFEPEAVRSGYRWDLGLSYYSETRDSGANFFFDRLPAGEYVLKYRVRATMSGRFRVGPAVLQSVYAPEFVGYSTGAGMVVGP